LLISSIGMIFYTNYQKNKVIADYEKLLDNSHQNYYLQSIANSNLEKKLQDLNLKLAEMRNTTIDLERMFNELSEEKVSLEEIRARMEMGIRRTKAQLDNMQTSVNSLINQRTKVIIYNEEEIIREKMDTHGK
ncbi:MAG: hypothetical protein MJZ61_08325, partial [Bacteroidales bacterium]|nr:hypothetical protein [Bacteroidales bacterium]